MLSLISQNDSDVNKLLKGADISPMAFSGVLNSKLEKRVEETPADNVKENSHIPFSQITDSIIRDSIREANNYEHSKIVEPRHLLLAILRNDKNPVANWLSQLGLNYDRAIEMLCGKKGDYTIVHPNDHVNMAQSTNDVIPTAGKLTVLDLLKPLDKSLSLLTDALYDKAAAFDHIVKIGRTQLEDAVPMRLGQTFHSYATMISRDRDRLTKVRTEMYPVNMGATAIGTAINTSPFYLDNIVPTLGKITGYPLTQADDLFDATENLDGFVRVSSCLKACAVNLSKMCNDLRILASGPKAGFGEITLPAMQNGSSIMPGKVNPVIPEVVSQVAFHIIGHDTTITMAAEAGQMELNAFEPVVFYNLFDSITTLTHAVDTLTANCILGITANEKRCRELLDASVGITTALCPYIGYKKAASLAKESLKTDIPVKTLVLKYGLLKENELDSILDPYAMTEARTRQTQAKAV